MVWKKSEWKIGVFFWIFLVIMLVVNFTGSYFGLTHFYWHLFLHIGIIVFSFLVLIYSLKLNEKAIRYVIFGSLLWIITNSVLILSHIFEEYFWLEQNIFIFLGMVIGSLMIMTGFKEAVNG